MEWKKKMKRIRDNNSHLIANKLEELLSEKRSEYAAAIPIAKAKEAWYLEFVRGIDADVFLECAEGIFIEEFLSPELANDTNIQSMRFRSSDIIDPHLRY